jgi:hypothetical protein
MSYVYCFHDGTLGGDCSEAYLTVDNPDLSFDEVKSILFSKEGLEENWHSEEDETLEEFIEINEDLVGAWILEKETFDKFCKASQFLEPRSDSACYAAQALFKCLYEEFAINSIGQQIVDEN